MIKNLSRRYPEVGRIRFGEKGEKGQPVKGDSLRFTSNDQATLIALADRVGGEVMPWPDGEQTFQLTSESISIEGFLPPDPLDTTYERWGKGGIARRCDGERCVMPVQTPDGGYMEESDCQCVADGLTPGDRDDIKKGACQVTVRGRFIIPDVPGLGVWMWTSHSWYAALELPGQVELLQAMGGAGLVKCELAIESRKERKPWEKYDRNYAVPVLRSRSTLNELRELSEQLSTAPLKELEIESQAISPGAPSSVPAIDGGDRAGSTGATDRPEPAVTDGGDGAESKRKTEQPQPANGDKPSEAQIDSIKDLLRALDILGPTRYTTVSAIIDRTVQSGAELTAAEASTVISYLQDEVTKKETAGI